MAISSDEVTLVVLSIIKIYIDNVEILFVYWAECNSITPIKIGSALIISSCFMLNVIATFGVFKADKYTHTGTENIQHGKQVRQCMNKRQATK